MTKSTVRLDPGSLWKRLIKQTNHARECGALKTIATGSEIIEENGVRFLVRILEKAGLKDAAKKENKEAARTGSKPVNPFLPYDPDLFVAEISESHICLLNKFNVVDNHLLIVTREFEHQETLLNVQDFEAMWCCMDEFAGMAFYNGGEAAGASQTHKHLQYIPVPMIPGTKAIPLEPLLEKARFSGEYGTIPDLPFQNSFACFGSEFMNNPKKSAKKTLELYLSMLENLNLEIRTEKTCAPYNLLVTREWMLMIPRKKESYETISVNSLGFAGSLLVRNDREMETLKKMGPIALLKDVAISNN